MKLLIAVPTRDDMPYQFVESFRKLIQKLDGDDVNYEVDMLNGTLVYVGRDRLAKKAIDKGFTHVLWLDSDMVFTEDLLDNLMECGKPFVTGIAHGRRAPYMSCIFKKIYPMVDRWEGCEYPLEPFRIGGCGFACVLIKTQVLESVYKANGTCFFPMRELGEDLAFCKRATDLHYEIWAEPTVQLGHVGQIVIYPEFQKFYENSVQNFKEVYYNA